MSKELGLGLNKQPLHNFTVNLLLDYDWKGQRIKKETELSIIAESRELANRAAIDKTRKTLDVFFGVKNAYIEVKGRKR